MATNPAEILAAGQALVPNYAEQQLRRQMAELQIQGERLQNQAATQQLAARKTALERQATFGSDMRDYLTHPTTTGLVTLLGNHPEFHDQIKEAHAALDEDEQRTNTTQIGSAAALASRGDYSGAAEVIRRRLDADKAAGHDTSDDQAILDHLNDPDETKRKAALGMMSIALAASVGPERASAFLKANGLSSEPYTLSQGEVRYDGQGNVIASVAAKPDYLIIPEGGKAVPVGPGGPQAAGTIQGNPSAPVPAAGTPAAPGTRRVQGWTPRARDGGDNSDAVVDSKIAQLSSAVGVDPDTPLTREQLSSLAGALPATEGGPGSKAARNNNPGNIQSGSFARSQPGYAGADATGYAKFKTVADGQAAMQALLNRYYSRGQRSIRDIIEGKPVAGRAVAQAPGAQPGDPAGTLYGNPKPGARVLTAAEATAKGLDPSKVYQQHPDGTVSTVGDANTGDSIPGNPGLSGEAYFHSLPPSMQPTVRSIIEGRFPITAKMTSPNVIKLFEAANRVDPSVDASTYQRRVATQRDFASGGKSGQAITSARTVINHLYDLARESEEIGGTSWQMANRVGNYFRGEMSDPKLQRYNATLTPLSMELPKFLGGKPPTMHEIEQTREDFTPNKGPGARRAQIGQTLELMDGRFGPILQSYNMGMNSSADIEDLIAKGDPVSAAKLRALRNWAAGGHLNEAGGAPGGSGASAPPGGKLLGHAPDGRAVYRLPNGQKVYGR